MQKTKIVIALVAFVALTLAVGGLASAQFAQNQTYTGANPNPQSSNAGFWGWIDNCFDFRAGQQYLGEQYIAPPVVSDSSVPTLAPYQGGYGYGYGPCWARYLP